MRLTSALEQFDYPHEARGILTSSGIVDLYPPQEEAIKKNILNGNSLLMSVPTAAGKTLIAEMSMITAILRHQGRCLYIAPLKALASEKYNEFKEKYAPLGIKVGLAIGDADSPSKQLNQFNIIIATAEKVDSLLRSQARWLIDGLSVVVLDEIHFINDGSRGPTLEILTARIKQLNPKVQFIALSATVSNADEIAGWLDAALVKSSWRPIPLKEGVYYNEAVTFFNDNVRLIKETPPDDVSKLALDSLKGKGQVLVFVNSRRSTQAASRLVAKSISVLLTAEEKGKLLELSKKIAGSQADATKVCHKLAEVIKCGVAFHHAGLKPRQRQLIEDHFKTNLIKVICCTPTLAAGVNLPARRAIIRDCKRFESGLGSAYIPTSEYKQCAGRAGRPQYDSYGEAILIAKSISEEETLFERYIKAGPEPVTSKLDDEASLRTHILASIAGGYVFDTKGMIEFMSHTFLAHQNKHLNLLDMVSAVFEFLHREKFIEKSGYRFFPTPFGSLTSRLYIDPLTSITLRDALALISKKAEPTPVGLLHVLTCCPDSPVLNIGKKDLENIEAFASHFHEDFILTPVNWPELDNYYDYMATLKTTWLLSQWIEEEREDVMCDQFNIGPGDIYRHMESARWLCYAAGTIADLFRHKSLTFLFQELQTRIRYGVKQELLDLIKLKGIGRIRARVLFQHGFTSMQALRQTTADELSQIRHIGKQTARDVMEQLNIVKQTKRLPPALEPVVAESVTVDEWED